MIPAEVESKIEIEMVAVVESRGEPSVVSYPQVTVDGVHSCALDKENRLS